MTTLLTDAEIRAVLDYVDKAREREPRIEKPRKWRNRFSVAVNVHCSGCGNWVGPGFFLDCDRWPDPDTAEEKGRAEAADWECFGEGMLVWIEAVREGDA